MKKPPECVAAPSKRRKGYEGQWTCVSKKTGRVIKVKNWGAKSAAKPAATRRAAKPGDKEAEKRFIKELIAMKREKPADKKTIKAYRKDVFFLVIKECGKRYPNLTPKARYEAAIRAEREYDERIKIGIGPKVAAIVAVYDVIERLDAIKKAK